MKHLGILLMAAALLGQGAGIGCSSSEDTSTTQQNPRRRTTRRPNAQENAAAASIDLAALQTEIPEYAGSGRDLFTYGREPTPVVERPPVEPTTATTAPPSLRRPTQPSASQPQVDLKFAGFVEKTQSDGQPRKFAVFLSGEEILTGAEGELVGNRYKVVEIGLESVTVAVEGTQFTQKIPLRAN
jgi:hypothetical protein